MVTRSLVTHVSFCHASVVSYMLYMHLPCTWSHLRQACILSATSKAARQQGEAHGVAEGPDDGVDDQLQLLRGHGKQRGEAVVGDGPQQGKEVQPVLWVVLHSQFGDQPNCAFGSYEVD